GRCRGDLAAKLERGARGGGHKLDDKEAVIERKVGIEPPSKFGVKLLCTVNIGDRDHNDLKFEVHVVSFALLLASPRTAVTLITPPLDCVRDPRSRLEDSVAPVGLPGPGPGPPHPASRKIIFGAGFGVTARKSWRLEAADEPGSGSRSEALRTKERVRGTRPAFDRRNLRFEPGHSATWRRRRRQECVAGILVRSEEHTSE